MGETELSMLWEPVDPAAALSDRFGFRSAEHAASWLTEALQEAWGRRPDRCDRVVISARNLLARLDVGGERVVAKCSVDAARFSRLAATDALIAWLHAQHLPVANPIPATAGRLRVEHDGVSLALYPFVAGDLLDVTDSGQVDEAGRMLALLHGALAAYPCPFDGGTTRSDQQLVHGDFRSANILHDRAGITAVLDFEDVTYRSRAADLARAAVLLGTQYRDWAPTTPQARNTFIAAYANAAPLSKVERDELYRSVAAVLYRFDWT